MGKKPVVALLGLWAGIALTGCGKCCQNCHNKYNAQPSFSKTSAPAPTSTTPAMVGDARTPATDTRVPDPTSNAGYATPATQAAATSPAGTPAPVTSTAGSTPAPVSSPVSQTNLRSNILDESPAPTPGTPVSARTDDGLGALPGGKASMEHVRRQIPPTPVIPKTDLPSSPMPVSASSPAPLPGTTTQVPDQVPPISGQPLPTIGSGSSLPPAPLPPAPLPAPETDTPKPSSAPSVPPYLK